MQNNNNKNNYYQLPRPVPLPPLLPRIPKRPRIAGRSWIDRDHEDILKQLRLHKNLNNGTNVNYFLRQLHRSYKDYKTNLQDDTKRGILIDHIKGASTFLSLERKAREVRRKNQEVRRKDCEDRPTMETLEKNIQTFDL